MALGGGLDGPGRGVGWPWEGRRFSTWCHPELVPSKPEVDRPVSENLTTDSDFP
jgi:hypothetical protein